MMCPARLRPSWLSALPFAAALLCVEARPALASAGGAEAALLPVLGALALVLVGARLGGALFVRFNQPAVLGELLVGVVLGNLHVGALDSLRSVASSGGLDLFAQLGVLFLLFSVGLETDVHSMAAVGASSLLVAVLGVVAPMGLGYAVSAALHPAAPALMHVFVGATLAATSVGITARVLGDLGRTNSAEGRIILGAAVIDDVLGLVVLAAVAGIIQAADSGAAFGWSSVAWIVLRAIAFLLGAVMIGRLVSRGAFALAARLKGDGVLLSVALAFCFGLSWLAGVAGLAPIVGAFAAGLVLDEVHYEKLLHREPHARSLAELLGPLSAFLVPVFFVLMGMQVDAGALVRLGVPMFALLLTVAAVLGKQACSLGVLEKGTDRIAVGLGMIPRGEVGLIFASIGASLVLNGEPVVSAEVYSAIVVVVAVTTLATPPLLAWRLRRPA